MLCTDAQPLLRYITGWPVAQPDNTLRNRAGGAGTAILRTSQRFGESYIIHVEHTCICINLKALHMYTHV